MSELIKYYYGLMPNELKVYEQICFFSYGNKNYVLVLIENSENYLLKNLELNDSIKYYVVVKSIFDNLVVDFNSNKYALFTIKNDYQSSVSLFDMVDFSKKHKINNDKYINWGDIWSKKLDFLNLKINKLTINDNSFLDMYAYFNGIAEEGIQYFNMLSENIKSQKVSKSICHRRIFSPNYKLNYYNPLVLLEDYEVRDYAEYFKNEIFNGDATLELLEKEFISLVNYAYLNSLEIKLFFSRVKFVSCFFDVVENIIDGKNNNSFIIAYEKKIKNYEMFLTFILNYINNNL